MKYFGVCWGERCCLYGHARADLAGDCIGEVCATLRQFSGIRDFSGVTLSVERLVHDLLESAMVQRDDLEPITPTEARAFRARFVSKAN